MNLVVDSLKLNEVTNAHWSSELPIVINGTMIVAKNIELKLRPAAPADFKLIPNAQ